MTEYFPGPYEIRIPYNVDGIQHELKLNAGLAAASPVPVGGADPDDIILNARVGSVNLQEGVDALWGAIRPLMSSSALAGTYEFWRYPVPGAPAVFVTSGSLTVPNGSGGTYTPAQQATYTFRSALGHIGKIVLMEAVQAGNARAPMNPAAPTAVGTLASYVISGDSWIIARDDSFLVAPLNESYGQNEAIFRRRFRR